MAQSIHITPEGPKPCNVDPTNPRSTGCGYPESPHYDNWVDAGAAFEQAQGGSFSVPLSKHVVAATKMDSSTLKKARPNPELTPAEMLQKDMDGKAVRDKLRKDHPEWPPRQVYAVYKKMLQTELRNRTANDPAQQSLPLHPIKRTNPIKASAVKSYPAPAEIDALIDKERENLARLGVKKGSYDFHAVQVKNAETEYSNLVKARQNYKLRNETADVHWVDVEIPPGLPFSDDKLSAAKDNIRLAEGELAKAQAEVESLGGGWSIPDPESANVIRVRIPAQKALVQEHILSQIREGSLSNARPGGHQKDWVDAKVIVDPTNVGRNFVPMKANYQLAKLSNSRVGNEMISSVNRTSGNTNYGTASLTKDLEELQTIFRTPRERRTVQQVEQDTRSRWEDLSR